MNPTTQMPVDPGKGLGIASLITAFLFAPAGVILGIFGLNQSKKAGHKNGLALAGLIVGSVNILLTILAIVGITLLATARYNEVLQQCKDMIPGSNPTVVTVNGELTCRYTTR